MKRDILFIGDPWDTLDHQRDSTLHLGQIANDEFLARCFWTLPNEIYFDQDSLFARIEGEVVCNKLKVACETRSLDSFHSIHWRVDPPVDLSTLRLWAMLVSTSSPETRFINPPPALLNWNEKFSALRFGTWEIPTLVSSSEHGWKTFFEAHGDRTLVAKPSGDAASRGVRILPRNWTSTLAALKEMRLEYGNWLILQEFDDRLTSHGETRVFTLGRKICGALNKKPKTGFPIMSLDSPSGQAPKLSVTNLNNQQKERAEQVAIVLESHGIYLATIDFIGDRILEINVTSPGLIKWMDERLTGNSRIAYQYWNGLFSPTH